MDNNETLKLFGGMEEEQKLCFSLQHDWKCHRRGGKPCYCGSIENGFIMDSLNNNVIEQFVLQHGFGISRWHAFMVNEHEHLGKLPNLRLGNLTENLGIHLV